MKIEFLNESGTVHVLARDQMYKGKFREELIFGEITPFHTGFLLKWSDSFFNPEPFTTLEEAQASALLNYNDHKPWNNGKSWL